MIKADSEKAEQKSIKEASPKTTVDFQNRYTLISTLNKSSLKLELKFYDLEGNPRNCFGTSFKNDSIPEELKIIFGNIQKLYSECFEQKINYQVEGSGGVKILYQIILNQKQIQREVYLPLEKKMMSEE